MALILGDIHGNFDKAQKFLAFKPEETHIFVGDYVDSFEATDEEIYATLKLCIESEAILLLGNHDLHYFKEPPFMCSGWRSHMAKGLSEIFEAFIDRFKPCIAVDGFMVTHGGISEGFGNSALKVKNVNEIANKITILWDTYLETRFLRKPNMPRVPNKIFNIDFSRGGRDSFAGIFWADYRSTKFYGTPQIFGHSRTTPFHDIINIAKDPLVLADRGNKNRKDDLWAIGCDNDRRICFNSATKEVESFD